MRLAPVVVAIAVLCVGACSPTEPISVASPADSTPATLAPVVSAQPTASADVVEDQSGEATVATSLDQVVEVYDEPDGGTFTELNASDVLTAPDATPFVFLVKQQRADWFEVWLPLRPNGSTGWIRAEEVTTTTTDYVIVIDIEGHMLTVLDDGVSVLATAIAVGKGEHPTPGGTYFIRELLQLPDPEGAYGPFAYGLSGYSPVLSSFLGGDAVIGIHGTNEPESIGQDVSHGCIRVPNDVISQMVIDLGLPLGTPVVIEA